MNLEQHAPDCGDARGAPMGRRLRPHSVARGRDAWEEDLNPGRAASQAARELAFTGEISLRRLYLDAGGYDVGGAYWGIGEPIFSALSECGTIDRTLRATSQSAAISAILKDAPRATVAPDEGDTPQVDGMTAEEVDDFIAGYEAAMLHADLSEEDAERILEAGDDPASILAPSTREDIRGTCAAFLAAQHATIRVCAGTHTEGSSDDTVWNHAGRDLWYTSRGHGAGFWDGDWPDPEAAQLTWAAKRCGSSDLYLGDDGLLYLG